MDGLINLVLYIGVGLILVYWSNEMFWFVSQAFEKPKRKRSERSALRDRILQAGWRISPSSLVVYRWNGKHPWTVVRPDGAETLMHAPTEDEAVDLLVDRFLELGLDPESFDCRKARW